MCYLRLKTSNLNLLIKVVTLGDPKNNGPEGIKLNLFSNNQVVGTAKTDTYGSYYFSNVMPGSYQVEASHPTIKFLTNKIQVVLSKETWSAKDNIVVSGFNVEGYAMVADKNPIANAQIYLHFDGSEEELKKLDISKYGCEQKSKTGDKLCSTKTDLNGKFTFTNLAFAKYKLSAELVWNNLVFSLKPEFVPVDLTKHKDQLVDRPFKLDSVSLKSFVYTSTNGKPLPNAQVFVNGKKSESSTGKDGSFELRKLTSDTYKIEVKSNNIYFKEKIVKIDLTNPNLLKENTVEQKNIQELSKFVPSSFDVCGSVRIKNEQKKKLSESDLQHSIQIKCFELVGQEAKLIKSAQLDAQMNYCLVLDANKSYVIRAVLSETLGQMFKLNPLERKISLTDSPLMNVNFEQTDAKLNVKVVFLPHQVPANDLIFTVKSLDSEWSQEVTASCSKTDDVSTCQFTLSNMLFGKYQLSSNYDELYCWSSNEPFSINSESENVQLKQTGFKLNYACSHKNVLIKLVKQNNVLFSKNMLNAADLKGSFCVPDATKYSLNIESCHKFTDSLESDVIQIDPSVFKRGSNQINLVAKKHLVKIEIYHQNNQPAGEKSIVNTNDLVIESDLPSEKPILLSLKSETSTESVFSGVGWFAANQLVSFTAKSDKVLFKANTLKLKVNEDNCAQNYVRFESKLGIFIVGKTNPSSIDEIALKLTLKSDNQVVQEQVVSGQGFKLGPLEAPASQYELLLSKSGFLFNKSSESTNKNQHEIVYSAQKLGQLKVNVVDQQTKTNLEGVLFSLSSEDRLFRKTLKSEQNGHASFENLKPGLYFLIVMMQEYEFTPNSYPIQITDGYQMNLLVEAKRIAYSCYGKVTSINGQVENGALVEAVSTITNNDQNEACVNENAKVDQQMFRIKNLKPGCKYELRVKNLSEKQLSSILPEFYEIAVNNEDLQERNFVVLEKLDNFDLSIAISYKKHSVLTPINYKSENNYVRVKLFKTIQPDYILQTQYTLANSILYLNSLSRDNGQYTTLVELLPPTLFSWTSTSSSLTQAQISQLNQLQAIQRVEFNFLAENLHKHLSVSFDYDKKSETSFDLRQNQYQNVYSTVPLFILVIALVLNWKVVQERLLVLNSLIKQNGGFLPAIRTLIIKKEPQSQQNNKSNSKQKGNKDNSDNEKLPKTKISKIQLNNSTSSESAGLEEFEYADEVDTLLVSKKKPKKI